MAVGDTAAEAANCNTELEPAAMLLIRAGKLQPSGLAQPDRAATSAIEQVRLGRTLLGAMKRIFG